MKELHEHGLTLARLFRIITVNDGTLAERIYCLCAIDYFIGVNANSRTEPIRRRNHIFAAMTDQFSDVGILKHHCKNRDLIDYIYSMKAAKRSFRAGGFQFMSEFPVGNLELMLKESTVESESMLIYARCLITGEPMKKNRISKDFRWFALAEESRREDNRE
jgi:hypothetical protein